MSLHFARVPVIAALALILLSAPGFTATRKLIECGWDEPNTSFMRRHIGQMEKAPFDGCVFHVEYPKSDGGVGNFTWEAWGRHAFRREDLMPAVIDLKATPFRKFRHVFLRFNATPADLDWFDDYASVLDNARLAGWAAREGGVAGIWLDLEQYQGRLFDYPKQRDKSTRSFEAYARQVRRRGYEVMDAFQRGYPDLTVFLAFGYAMPWRGSAGGRIPLTESVYGLLPAFFDGMVDATRGRARIVDGQETTYPIREPWQIGAAKHEMRKGVLPIVANPAKYRRVVSCAFAIWMDYDWNKNGWNVEQPHKNYRPPRTFELVMRNALQATDEYVWLYTEQPRWWTEKGAPEKLPAEYVDAVKRARGMRVAPSSSVGTARKR
jgi:hypothetical protein